MVFINLECSGGWVVGGGHNAALGSAWACGGTIATQFLVRGSRPKSHKHMYVYFHAQAGVSVGVIGIPVLLSMLGKQGGRSRYCQVSTPWLMLLQKHQLQSGKMATHRSLVPISDLCRPFVLCRFLQTLWLPLPHLTFIIIASSPPSLINITIVIIAIIVGIALVRWRGGSP